jgi:hypothetical protein
LAFFSLKEMESYGKLEKDRKGRKAKTRKNEQQEMPHTRPNKPQPSTLPFPHFPHFYWPFSPTFFQPKRRSFEIIIGRRKEMTLRLTAGNKHQKNKRDTWGDEGIDFYMKNFEGPTIWGTI